jgi:hypothetical protein
MSSFDTPKNKEELVKNSQASTDNRKGYELWLALDKALPAPDLNILGEPEDK